jgi:hypothetical protein
MATLQEKSQNRKMAKWLAVESEKASELACTQKWSVSERLEKPRLAF